MYVTAVVREFHVPMSYNVNVSYIGYYIPENWEMNQEIHRTYKPSAFLSEQLEALRIDNDKLRRATGSAAVIDRNPAFQSHSGIRAPFFRRILCHARKFQPSLLRSSANHRETLRIAIKIPSLIPAITSCTKMDGRRCFSEDFRANRGRRSRRRLD